MFNQSFSYLKNPFLYGQPVNTARFLWRVGDQYNGVPSIWIYKLLIILGNSLKDYDFSGKKILKEH